ncbi:MAG: glycosyltransferase family A protein [Lachnospiraceae bacterium]
MEFLHLKTVVVVEPSEGGTYLIRGINALIKQTYFREMQIDFFLYEGDIESIDIVQEISKGYDNISYYKVENNTLLNAAVSSLNEEYVLFIKVSDVLAPNMVENMMQKIIDDDLDIAIPNLVLMEKPDLPEIVEIPNDLSVIDKENDSIRKYYIENPGPMRQIWKSKLIKEVYYENDKLHYFLKKCNRLNILNIEDAYAYVLKRDNTFFSVDNLSLSDMITEVIKVHQNLQDISSIDFEIVYFDSFVFPWYEKMKKTTDKEKKALLYLFKQYLIQINCPNALKYIGYKLDMNIELFINVPIENYINLEVETGHNNLNNKTDHHNEESNKRIEELLERISVMSEIIKSTNLPTYFNDEYPTPYVIKVTKEGKIGLKTIIKCFTAWAGYKFGKRM